MDVGEYLYPLSVDWLAGGEVRTLTDADTTATWVAVWHADWATVVCGALLLAAVALLSRGWSRRLPDQVMASTGRTRNAHPGTGGDRRYRAHRARGVGAGRRLRAD